MKTKRILKISGLLLVVLILVSVGVAAWIFTPGLREPVMVAAPDYWPTDGWQAKSPEQLGFKSSKLAEGLLDIQERGLAIDNLLIIRDGYVVLNADFAPYDGTFPHDLASVTKSVMTTLIGIAADKGLLNLDTPMVSFFPNRTIANLDERKSRMTVRHLAGMVNGMESDCWEGDEPTLDAMRIKPDWIQATLDRPMVSEPGKKFCYDSPGMHLLSAILQEATGMTSLDFARQNLFQPMGIQDVIWETDPQGYTRGWGDLHLLPEDAAKIGYLWLQRGNWNGVQIVPEAWVLDSSRAHSTFAGNEFGYGYGWWISPADVYALGRGGQMIRVIASLNTVVVITGGGFDPADIDNFLLPALLHSNKPLTQDHEGQIALENALNTVRNDDRTSAAVTSPEMEQELSGRTYQCDDNLASIESVRIDFEHSGFATMFLKMGGVQTTLPIGLEGKYLFDSLGAGYRGWWQDARTFNFEAFDIGVLHRQILFEEDRMNVTLPELDLTITCRVLSS